MLPSVFIVQLYSITQTISVALHLQKRDILLFKLIVLKEKLTTYMCACADVQ